MASKVSPPSRRLPLVPIKARKATKVSVVGVVFVGNPD
jgi:hypothetical protein